MLVVALAWAGTVSPADAGRDRARVLAAFYPLEWATDRVGDEHVDVTGLTPAGAEPHDLELTTDDRAAIEDADLLVVLSGGFQPAVEESAEQRDGPTLDVRRALSASQQRRAERDPHIWLDPLVMQEIVDAVARRLAAIDTQHAAAYDREATALIAELDELDGEFTSGLVDCERDLLVTAHEAFGWLTRRYGIRQQGVAGIDPEQEPKPQRLAELSDLVRDEGVTTIFTEARVSPKIAETLAAEAGGLRTAVLNPLESLSANERDRGEDYLSVMRTNLEKIRVALDCS